MINSRIWKYLNIIFISLISFIELVVEQLIRCLDKNSIPLSPLDVLIESVGMSALSSDKPTAKATLQFLDHEKNDEINPDSDEEHWIGY